MKSEARMIEFKQNGDERGYLVAIEGLKDVPFEIKRVFYIYGSDRNIVRGSHANKKSEFMLVNVKGTSKVKTDDGREQKIFDLDRAHVGLYIPRMVWKDMYDFSQDSILLVLASEPYDPAEYIRDKEEYYRELGKLK